VALTAVVILPLVFFRVLPAGELLTFLIAPPPPPPPIELVLNFHNDPLTPKRNEISIDTPPTVIPIGVPPPTEEPSRWLWGGMRVPGIPPVAAPPAGLHVDGTGLLEAVPPPMPPPPPPPPARKPLPVGGNVLAAKVMARAEPEYPALAIRARVSGMVILQVQVNEEGSVTDVQVLSGHPMLVQAAVLAVSQWRYSPTLLNGEPVPVSGTVTVHFKLR
ncbi:MAG: energy transducer TonB, partial [Acidobacteriota bacterium]